MNNINLGFFNISKIENTRCKSFFINDFYLDLKKDFL